MEEIEKNDLILSGNRYKTFINLDSTAWNVEKLSNVTEIYMGQSPEGQYYNEKKEGLPFYQGKTDFGIKYLKEPSKWTTQTTKEAIKNDILMSVRAPVGPVNLAPFNLCIGRGLCAIRPNEDKLNYLFLFYCLKSIEKNIASLATGSTFKAIRKDAVENIKIPLPSIEVQNEIVKELNGYQKVIGGARQIIENYKPNIDIKDDWKMVKIEEVSTIRPQKSEISALDKNMEVSFIPMLDLNEGNQEINVNKSKKLSEVYKGYVYFKDNDVLLAKITPCFENGKSGIAKDLVNGIGFGSTEFIVIRPTEKVLSEWLYYFISQDRFIEYGKNTMTGSAGQQRININFVSKYQIPLPNIEEQQIIIQNIKEESEIVILSEKAVKTFEKKIQDKLNYIWGK